MRAPSRKSPTRASSTRSPSGSNRWPPPGDASSCVRPRARGDSPQPPYRAYSLEAVEIQERPDTNRGAPSEGESSVPGRSGERETRKAKRNPSLPSARPEKNAREVSLQDLVGRVSFDSKGKALDAEGNVRFERRRGAEADPDANGSDANASEANASEANASEANADATPKFAPVRAGTAKRPSRLRTGCGFSA